jgi:hypothetical protein
MYMYITVYIADIFGLVYLYTIFEYVHVCDAYIYIYIYIYSHIHK